MNTNTTLEIPELKVIEASKADQIKATFIPMSEMLKGFEASYKEVLEESKQEITAEVTQNAKTLRIAISKIRIETEKARKEQKADYLRAGKAIDGVANIIKWAVGDMEEKLKEIEKHFENVELARLQALQEERAGKLSKYVDDADERDLSGMDQDVWEAYYNTKKQDYEDRIEAEKKAEAERLRKQKEEEAERLRIKAENERLKAEAEAKAKKEKEEREERERLAKIEADKRAKEEAKRRAEAEKIRLENEAKLKAERDAREKEQREAKARQDAIEAKAKAEREALQAKIRAQEEKEAKAAAAEAARVQAELSKGDAEKMKDLIERLKAFASEFSFESDKYKAIYFQVGQMTAKMVAHIEKSISQ